MSLDKKLREIIHPAYWARANEFGGDGEKDCDEAIAQIKQAFKDEGYRKSMTIPYVKFKSSEELHDMIVDMQKESE